MQHTLSWWRRSRCAGTARGDDRLIALDSLQAEEGCERNEALLRHGRECRLRSTDRQGLEMRMDALTGRMEIDLGLILPSR